MKPWWTRRIGRIVVLATIAVGIAGTVIMLLWNALIPELFHGPSISYLQAIGLLVLLRLLLRVGFRWHSGGWRHDRWRQRLEARMAAMTPEEREKFKAEWGRCGFGHDFPSPAGEGSK